MAEVLKSAADAPQPDENPAGEYAASIPGICLGEGESGVSSCEGHIVLEKGDRDRDICPLTPLVCAGKLRGGTMRVPAVSGVGVEPLDWLKP